MCVTSRDRELSIHRPLTRLHLLISASQKMMSNVHLAGDTGDMYGGFGREDVAPALDTADLEFDSGFQVMT